MIKSEVKLLGIQLDYKLNFEQHISELCRKAASQLNVVKDSNNSLALVKAKFLYKVLYILILIIARIVVWYFSSAKSLQKIEKIQERALRFVQ